MAEIKLREVVPRVNTRGVMGRVVVRAEILENPVPRVTGTIIMCCNRAYLTKESYQRHKDSGECNEATAGWKGFNFKSSSDGKTPSVASNSEGDDDEGFDSGENERPFTVESVVQCLLASPSATPRIQSNVRKAGSNTTSPTKYLHGENAKWGLGNRKISFLERESNLANPNYDPVDVMSLFKTIKSEDGEFVFSCRKCFFTSHITSQITEHVKTVHSDSLAIGKGKSDQITQGIKEDISVNEMESTKKLFTCSLCKIYHTNVHNNLKMHIRRSHGPLPNGFSCRFCTCCFSTKRKRTVHEQTYHQTKLSSQKRERQYSDVINKKVKCDLCSLSFKTLQSVKRHKRGSHVQGGRYPCSFCTCVFGISAGLSTHMNIFHKNSVGNQQVLKQEPNGSADGVQSERKENLCENSLTKRLHKCQICLKVCHTKQMLIVHQRTRHRIKMFTGTSGVADPAKLKNARTKNKCSLCSRIFSCSSELGDHVKSCHVKGGSYPCPVTGCNCICDKQRSLSAHLIWHKKSIPTLESRKNVKVKPPPSSNEVVSCELCEMTVKNETELNFHLKSSHVICGVQCECGCSFSTATELTQHKSKECPKIKLIEKKSSLTVNDENNKSLLSSLKEQQEVSPANVRKSPTTCSCGTEFQSRYEFLEHMRMAKCQPPEQPLENNDLCPMDPKVELGPEKEAMKIPCPTCGSLFKSATGLRVHILYIHAKNAPKGTFSKCEICSYPTKNFGNYTRHKKSCHVEGGIPCLSECNTSFKSIEGLSAHFKMMHKDKKFDKSSYELKCAKCDYITFRQTDLNLHEKTVHLKIKNENNDVNLTCQLCNFEANGRYSLKYHMEKAHVESGYKCEFCCCQYGSEAGLRVHCLKWHSEEYKTEEKESLSCEKCDYTTTSQKNYLYHQETNHVEGEDSYKCDICNNSFRSEHGLRSHSYKHTKDNSDGAFSLCKICDYQTGTYKNYKEHMKRCHVPNGVGCPDCNCSLKDGFSLYKHALIRHKKKINLKEFEKKCSTCSFVTHSPALLKQHEATHSKLESSVKDSNPKKEYPTCDLCGFKITGNMEAHISRAHFEGGKPCSKCQSTFRNDASLISHLRFRHGLKQEKVLDPSIFKHSCSRCKFRSRSHQGLNSHSLKMHGVRISFPREVETGRRVCSLCNLTYSGTTAAHNRVYHVENGFRCFHCPCQFETYSSRLRHTIKVHKIFTSKRCDLCGLKFTGTIKMHTQKCHVKDGIKCSVSSCCCTFPSEQAKVAHIRHAHKGFRTDKPNQCDICGLNIKETIAKHLDRCHVKDGYGCIYCPCSFASENSRALHMGKIHRHKTALGPQTCKLCFAKVGTLWLHMKRSHTPNGLKCDFCVCTFRNERGKAFHMRRMHKGSMPVESKICKLCGIKFSSKAEHFKYHHIENGISCPRCPCTLKSEASKLRHMARYHNIRTNANKRCNVCGMKYHGTLAGHMRSHHHSSSNYQCPYCNCKLKSKDGRRIHIFKMHKDKSQKESSEQIYSNPHNACKLCGIETSEPLEDHIRRCHCISNPFSCSHCTCRFLTKNGLMRHFLIQHKKTIKKPSNTSPKASPSKTASKTSPSKNETVEISSPQKIRLRKPLSSNSKSETSKTFQSCPSILPSGQELKIGQTISLPRETNKKDGGAVESESSSTSSSCSSSRSHFENKKPKESKVKSDSVQLSKEKLTCLQCGYVAKCISLLNMHMQKSHVKNSLNPCPRCSCSFANESELSRHLKIFHPVPVFIVKELSRVSNNALNS